jgi:lipocalin
MNLFKLLMTFCLGSFLQPTESNVFHRELTMKETPDTIDQIDLDSYLGYWYQIYGSPTNVIFQGYGKCITAEYGSLDNGYISVLNSQRNLENELEQISGYAYYKNVSEPGQLTVHLDGTPVDAPYWIVLLGEVKDEQYQYSIITTPSGVSLWVLVRDIDVFLENYDEEVREFLEDNNYKYVAIEHDENCVYA